jgi:hypothetical protein
MGESNNDAIVVKGGAIWRAVAHLQIEANRVEEAETVLENLEEVMEVELHRRD